MAIAPEELEQLEPPSDEELTHMAEAEGLTEEIIVIDDESMALINTVTGEVVGYQEIPPEDLADLELAKWVGERRVYHKGKAEGLEAEMNVWIDTITARYEARIKRHKGAVEWLEKTHEPFLFALAKRLIGDGKKRSVAVGLLLLKLRKTSAKTEVLDPEKAISWLEKAGITEAVKTTKTVMVSMLPNDLKDKLVKESNQEKTGIAYRPGGKEELKIE